MKKIDALGNVFAAEVEGRLPFQSSAAIYKKLCDEGMLQEMTDVVGTVFGKVTISGYQLTHVGRWTYCESCSGQPDTTESGK